MALSEDFEDMSKEIKSIAKERKANHEKLIKKALEEHIQIKVKENLAQKLA